MIDVAVVGAGLAGTCAAHVLARAGKRVALVDRSSRMPDLFRAEKIEADQAELLRGMDLLRFRAPEAGPIGTTINFDGCEATPFDTIEQYGISYGPTVNSLRSKLPPSVETIVGDVRLVTADARAPEVHLRSGRRVRARLVMLATGGSDGLIRGLGIERVYDRSLVSLTFGFAIAPEGFGAFAFNGFNYYLGRSTSKIDYVTIFPIGDAMRVNLFTQLLPTDELVADIKRHPIARLRQRFPLLEQRIGPIRQASKVQVVPTVYHRLRRPARDGVVIIGEEFQSVSPTTGKGLSRVLTDVKVLCEDYAPRWLAGAAITSSAIRAFYRDTRKVASDRDALDAWMYYHNRMLPFGAPLTLRIKQRMRLRGWTV